MIKSRRIFTAVENKSWFLKSDIILAYWAMTNEVQTQDFILKWSGKKTFLLPVVKGSELELRKFQGEGSMVKGTSYDIMEPAGPEFTDFPSVQLVIVPGIAFDLNHNRLGRGKAYYDKLLPKLPNAFTAGVCFDFQIVAELPLDSHDMKMNEVIFA